MKPSSLSFAALLCLLAACTSEPEPETAAREADEFAARINNKKKVDMEPDVSAAPVQVEAPTVATPVPNAAPGSYVPGTATDPNSACNAGMFAPFLGQQPNEEVRAQIMERAVDLPEVRFISPGGQYIKPDPTNPRLNIMVAVDGVIRDIRCG